MDMRKLAGDVYVSDQITVGDIGFLVEAGIKSVICNRPDGEAMDQPTFEEISEAARAAGLEARFIPFVPGQAGQAEVDQFAAALRDLPAPVLAYCRSGARSTTLFDAVRAQAG